MKHIFNLQKIKKSKNQLFWKLTFWEIEIESLIYTSKIRKFKFVQLMRQLFYSEKFHFLFDFNSFENVTSLTRKLN